MIFQSKPLQYKLELLETKLNMFEELSKDMMNTLNDAVSKISEANQTISKCLVAHDEKLKQSEQNDRDIKSELSEIRTDTDKKIQDLKESNVTDHKNLADQIKSLDSKLDENNKFRLKVTGAVLIIGFLIGLINTLPTISKVVNIVIEEPTPVEIKKP